MARRAGGGLRDFGTPPPTIYHVPAVSPPGGWLGGAGPRGIHAFPFLLLNFSTGFLGEKKDKTG